MRSLIKIGTRGSQLALYQAELVRAKLKESFPLMRFEFIKIRTKGDMIRHANLGAIGPGIFTREIETALLKKEIDLAVHSAKDLATDLPAGLAIGAILDREDPRDCLVARARKTLKELASGARIGTSSLRRRAQLKRLRPDLEICEMRGNVDTRVKKIEEGNYDGMVLAHAGMRRLGLGNLVGQVFDEEVLLPQAGQGAIAIELCKDDAEIQGLIRVTNHEASCRRILAERSFLRRLQGGCQVPVGVASRIKDGLMTLTGGIFSWDGGREVRQTLSGSILEGEDVGTRLAERLLEMGGEEILDEIRKGVK
ncbi:MAG: hydroxymethylbilane synthase [Candidatus Omnitrophica bacterium]|nr:hydroxymethylbilane synthase [Candidatus Omnitrophota bacterium]